MDPQRKRTIRLVIALSVAVFLGAALIYTSFSASTDAKQPSELFGAAPGTSYDMTGSVVPGSIRHNGDNGIAFRVEDREGESRTLPVSYDGVVPPAFQAGREIVLTGAMKSGTFVGEPETLVTKCPSKYTTASNG